MKKRPRILTLSPHFLPGFKAGGPIRSLANLFETLSGEFEFSLITGDRDLGDDCPYDFASGVEWRSYPGVNVKYLSVVGPQCFSSVRKALREFDYDAIYLNSFFSVAFSIYPAWLMKMGLIRRAPVLIAPRGEFSPAALMLKGSKKSFYRRVALGFGIYSNVFWQASSDFEAADIARSTGVPLARVFVASDLPTRAAKVDRKLEESANRTDRCRLVFLGRIVPIKNLEFCLKVLAKVKSDVEFDIYGPIEDSTYYDSCVRLISQLPKNVEARYIGVLSHAKVTETLKQYDLLFLPSRGENYGHVVAEALAVGTEVLVSDRTPWRNLEHRGLGRDFSLDSPSSFSSFIEERSRMSQEKRGNLREKILASFIKEESDSVEVRANERMFRAILASGGRRD